MFKSYNIRDFMLFNIESCEEILILALDSLECKKGTYYSLIKEYILNYKKIDTKMQNKIKKVIMFLQEFAKLNSQKTMIKNLNYCLNNLGAVANKSLYIRLYSICIKYSETTIIKTFLNSGH